MLVVNHTQIHSQWKDEGNERGEGHMALNTYFSGQQGQHYILIMQKYKKCIYVNCKFHVGAYIQINCFTKRHQSSLFI